MKKEKDKPCMNSNTHTSTINLIKNSSSSHGKGFWRNAEHEKFIEAVFLFDKNWKKVSEYIKTRTVEQSRSHSQKYFKNLKKKILETRGDTHNVKKWIKNFVRENVLPIIFKFHHYVEHYHQKLENFCQLILKSIKNSKEKKNKRDFIKCCCYPKKLCDCGDQCCKISTTNEEDNKEIFFDSKNFESDSEDSLIEENNFTKIKSTQEQEIFQINPEGSTIKNLEKTYSGGFDNLKSEGNFWITLNKIDSQSKLKLDETSHACFNAGIISNVNFNERERENFFQSHETTNEMNFIFNTPEVYDQLGVEPNISKINFENLSGDFDIYKNDNYENDDEFFYFNKF
jgi:SHAQKYF class myb-like DNA-binding protein